MMCQPSENTMVASTSPTCPTIKANARLRRSHRAWTDQQSGNNASLNDNTKNNTNNADGAKKNRRSRRRPAISPRKPLVEFNNDCDVSAASTAPLSSDESFSCDGTVASMSSFAVHNSNNNNAPLFKSKQKMALTGNNGSSPTSSTTPNKKTQRNSKKRSTKKRPTVVNIVVNDSNTSNSNQPSATLTPEEKSRYIALDAEMVGIGPSGSYSRLARIALIDYDGNTLYDTMVRVEERVTDYRTFVSGITEADITSDRAVSFDVAQSTVRQLIHNKIVVGHGLKNDFKVLGLSHPWYDIRDTAKYEPFMKVPEQQDYNPNNATLVPKKLRILAKDKLGLDIQVEGCPHSPVEDALAALELYKRHRLKWEKAMMYKMERTREIVGSSTQ